MTLVKTHGKPSTWKKCVLTAMVSALFVTVAPAYAAANTAEKLLEILKAKKIISAGEYESLATEIAEEKAIDKDERRKAKMKEALADEAKEKQKEAAKTELKAKFKDGITWESADKSHALSLNGRIQLDYRTFDGADALVADTFDVRRAYLTAKGKFYDYYTFDVTGDFGSTSGVPTALALDVAFLNIAWWKQAEFRFGQFKMPFSLEEQTSSRFIDFQERSMGNVLVPAKERGIMLHGEPFKGVNYGLALSAGQGKNTNDVNNVVDSNDVIGRVAVNFAEMFDQKDAVYHLGAAFSDGTRAVSAPATGRTEGRGINFFTAAAFTGLGTAAELDRSREGFEAAVAYGPIKFQTEYLSDNFEGTSAAGIAFDRSTDVYYASLGWLITGEKYADAYKGGKFDRIRPKENFSPSGGSWGAWELGLRYTNWDASDYKGTNPVGTGVLAAGTTNEAKAWTLGLKWMPNSNTRLMLNYIMTDFATPVTVTPAAGAGSAAITNDEGAWTFRAQFDF